MSSKRKKRVRRQALLTNRVKNKLALLFAIIVLALIGVNVRLAYINKTNGDKYTKRVLAQQDTNSTLLPFRRGDILDRNGTILATSEKVYNLIIDARLIMSDAENYLEPTVQALVQSFGFDAAELRTLIEERNTSAYVRYGPGRQLTYDQKTAFEELEDQLNDTYRTSDSLAESKKRVKGIWLEDEYKRIYP